MAPRLWPPGICSMVASIPPSRTLASASGSASKPMIAMSSPCSCTTCSAPSAMSSFAATITSGGDVEPGEDRLGHRRPLLAHEVRRLLGDEHVLVLQPSRMLCTPLLRSIAGLAPGWPCRFTIFAPSGNFSTIRLRLRLAALHVVRAHVPEDASTPSTRRSMVMTGTPASTAALHRRRHGHRVERADDEPVDAADHRRLHVGGLLRGRVLAVVVDHLDPAQLLRLGVELVLHVHEEREAEARQRRGDLQDPAPAPAPPTASPPAPAARQTPARSSVSWSSLPEIAAALRPRCTPAHYPAPPIPVNPLSTIGKPRPATFQPLSSLPFPSLFSQMRPHDPRPHLRRRKRPHPLGRAPPLPPAPPGRGGHRRLLRRGRLPRLERRVRPRHPLGRGRRRAQPPATPTAPSSSPPSTTAGTRPCPGPVEGAPELLAELAPAGVPLYAITNFSSAKFAETRERFPFLASTSATSSSPATKASSSPTRRSTAAASPATPRARALDLHRRQPGQRRRRRRPRHRRHPLHLHPPPCAKPWPSAASSPPERKPPDQAERPVPALGEAADLRHRHRRGQDRRQRRLQRRPHRRPRLRRQRPGQRHMERGSAAARRDTPSAAGSPPPPRRARPSAAAPSPPHQAARGTRRAR